MARHRIPPYTQIDDTDEDALVYKGDEFYSPLYKSLNQRDVHESSDVIEEVGWRKGFTTFGESIKLSLIVHLLLFCSTIYTVY